MAVACAASNPPWRTAVASWLPQQQHISSNTRAVGAATQLLVFQYHCTAAAAGARLLA
jgi:hypothetical protein